MTRRGDHVNNKVTEGDDFTPVQTLSPVHMFRIKCTYWSAAHAGEREGTGRMICMAMCQQDLSDCAAFAYRANDALEMLSGVGPGINDDNVC